MGSVQDYILLYLWLVWIRRIGRQEEFKIPLCNPSGGNLLRQSCQTSTTGLFCKNSQQPKHVDCFCKRAPPQTSDQILNADSTRGVVNVGCGWNVSAWNSWLQPGVQGSGWEFIKLKEILLPVEIYEKSYISPQYEIPLVVIRLGVTGLKKIRLVIS